MFTIRKLTYNEPIRSKDLHRLWSQLTNSTLLSKNDFKVWCQTVQSNPLFILFGVIKDNDVLVGLGALWLQPKYFHAPIGHIEDIVIDEKYRGQKLGSYLVQAIINCAKNEKSCHQVILRCKEKNIGFYEKQGLKVNGANMQLKF